MGVHDGRRRLCYSYRGGDASISPIGAQSLRNREKRAPSRLVSQISNMMRRGSISRVSPAWMATRSSSGHPEHQSDP